MITSLVTSLVDHDFAQDGPEQSTVSVGNPRCLDVDVSSLHGTGAGDVKPRLEQGFVESRQISTRVVGAVDLLFASAVVHVDGQSVKVVHVVLLSAARI